MVGTWLVPATNRFLKWPLIHCLTTTGIPQRLHWPPRTLSRSRHPHVTPDTLQWRSGPKTPDHFADHHLDQAAMVTFDHRSIENPTCDDDFGLIVYICCGTALKKVRHRGMTDVSRPKIIYQWNHQSVVADFCVLFLLLTCWKHTNMCEHMETMGV